MTTPENGALLGALEDLLDALDLAPAVSAPSTAGGAADDSQSDFGVADTDVFIGRSQPMPHGRVFGGQVLAQSIIAAGRTVNDLDDAAARPRRIHSLHGYFLRPGDSNHPIRFTVERLRDAMKKRCGPSTLPRPRTPVTL